MYKNPTAEEVMKNKHEAQIRRHEARFGKLGELQTPEEKNALERALEESKSE